jgi:serine protease Do
MNSGKAWGLALGLFLVASLSPVAKAQEQDQQKQQDQQKPTGNFVAQKSQDKNDSAFGGKSGQNSNGENAKEGESGKGNNEAQQREQNSKDSSKQGSRQQDWNKSNSQQKSGAQQSYRGSSKDHQNMPRRWNFPDWSNGDHQGQGWEDLLSGNGQGWIRGAGPHAELNLAAADESVRQHLNLPSGQGVVVLWVAPNSGAAQAGIEENDILLTLGEAPLGKPEDLYDRLKQAGEKPVPLTLLRSGGRITLQVQPLIQVTLRPALSRLIRREYWIGLSVTAIEPVLRAQLRLSKDHGVIVNQVFPDSPAAKSGIALHEIIVEVDGNPISDPSDLARSVQTKGTKPLVLKLAPKGGKSRDVTVTPERKKSGETSPVLRESLNSLHYDVVRPGVVLGNATPLYNTAADPTGAYLSTVPLISDIYTKPRDGGSALDKRLDSLDSDIKDLRKLVEALQKTATRIIEQQQK